MGKLSRQVTFILDFASLINGVQLVTLLHTERSKLHRVLAILSAIGKKEEFAGSKLFPIRVDSFLEGFHSAGRQTRSHESCSPL